MADDENGSAPAKRMRLDLEGRAVGMNLEMSQFDGIAEPGTNGGGGGDDTNHQVSIAIHDSTPIKIEAEEYQTRVVPVEDLETLCVGGVGAGDSSGSGVGDMLDPSFLRGTITEDANLLTLGKVDRKRRRKRRGGGYTRKSSNRRKKIPAFRTLKLQNSSKPQPLPKIENHQNLENFASTNNLLVPLQGNNLHCLICFQKNGRRGSANHQTKSESGEYSELKASCQVIFLLKTLLEIPTEDLIEYLQTLGSPNGWIGVCPDCQPMISEALEVNDKIVKLSKELRKCRDKIVDRMKATLVENQDSQEGNVRSRRSLKKVVVTDVARKFVLTKSYERHSPFLDGDKIAETMLPSELKLSCRPKRNVKQILPIFQKQDDDWSAFDDDNFDNHYHSDSDPDPTYEPEVQLFTTNDNSNENNNVDPSNEPQPPPKVPSMSPSPRVKRRRAKTTAKQKKPPNKTHSKRKSTDIKCELSEDPVANKPIRRPTSRNPIIQTTIPTDNNPFAKVKTRLTKYICPNCPALKEMCLDAFIYHLLFHFTRPYKCTNCSWHLPNNESAADRHWEEFHRGCESPDVKCTREVFSTSNILVWECSKCKEIFPSSQDRDCHEGSVHKTFRMAIDAPYPCKTCSNSFHTVKEWRLHRVLEHPEIDQFSCFFCDKYFLFKADGFEFRDTAPMKVHLSQDHNYLKTAIFFDVCDHCGDAFPWKMDGGGVAQHYQDKHHLTQRQWFVCPICQSGLKSKKQFFLHVKRHSSVRAVCEICGWIAKSDKYLKHHRQAKHGIESAELKLIKCSFAGCDFQSPYNGHINFHEKSHKKDRPYMCRFCGKSFKHGPYLREHEKIHTNATTRPFKCEICGNSFAVPKYLYIHKRLSHQGRFFPSTRGRKMPSSSGTAMSRLKGSQETSHFTDGVGLVNTSGGPVADVLSAFLT